MNSKKHTILTIRLGITNCYLIGGGTNYILVDAGPPNALVKFGQQLEELGIAPAQIKLIVVTHMHFDHVGSLAGISRLTGARSAMHSLDREKVEQGSIIMPRGIGIWGKLLSPVLWAMKPLVKKAMEPVPVDLRLDESPFTLEAFQVSGKVLHTPGHTPGSLSLVLDSGEAFVGDLAMSGFPRLSGPGPFVLGDDPEAMKKSWQLLLDEGVRQIFPSHGKPFKAAIFNKYLKA